MVIGKFFLWIVINVHPLMQHRDVGSYWGKTPIASSGLGSGDVNVYRVHQKEQGSCTITTMKLILWSEHVLGIGLCDMNIYLSYSGCISIKIRKHTETGAIKIDNSVEQVDLKNMILQYLFIHKRIFQIRVKVKSVQRQTSKEFGQLLPIKGLCLLQPTATFFLHGRCFLLLGS